MTAIAKLGDDARSSQKIAHCVAPTEHARLGLPSLARRANSFQNDLQLNAIAVAHDDSFQNDFQLNAIAVAHDDEFDRLSL